MRTYTQGYYKVTADGPLGAAVVDVERLAEALPHGSGIDTDWYVHIFKNGSVLVSTKVHEMDDYGGYYSWTPVSFWLRRAKSDRIHSLSGPCEGQTQTLYRRGDVIGRVHASKLRCNGQDWFAETVMEALREYDIPVAWWD